MSEIVCLRCGKCCHFIVKGKVTKCGNLVKLKDGTTRCRVYATRLGRPLAKGIKCGFRIQSLYDFPNCPFNSNKPLFPEMIK